MMDVSPQELLPGAKIRRTPGGPKRVVYTVVPEPENKRIYRIVTDRGDLFCSMHDTVTLVDSTQ